MKFTGAYPSRPSDMVDCMTSRPSKEKLKMNDLTYEFQRMISRSAEIKQATRADGAQAAWERYSREHGLNQQRFKGELGKLRDRFEGIGSGESSA